MSGLLAIVAAIVAAGVTALGIHAARRRDAQVRRAAPLVIAFAAGVLVTASLAHLIPHALSEAPSAPLWALGGFVSMVLLARVVDAHAGAEEREATSWLALFGIGLHSLLDGPTYTIAFAAGGAHGATVALGMILHELPEGLIAYALLVRGDMSPRRAAWIAWLAAGLTTPVGAVLAAPVLGELGPYARAALVAIAGGVLLHVGAAHLLPQMERRRTRFGLLAFGLGVAIALGSMLYEHH